MDSPRDTQHVLSEFEDAERQSIFRRLCKRYPDSVRPHRTDFFAFWFADLGVLRRLADRNRDNSMLLEVITRRTSRINVPSLCE